MAETLDSDGVFRYCFEPLEPYHRHPDLAHLSINHYAAPGDREPSIADPLDRLLSGRLFTTYSDRWDPHPSLRPRSRLLVKLTHANLLLGWLTERAANARAVLVVRHPLAVVSSRRRLSGLDWSDDDSVLAALIAQPQLVRDHLGPFLDVIAGARSRLDQQVVLWCIEQLVPISQSDRLPIHVVRYEDCLMYPASALPPMFEAASVHLGRSVFGGLSRPSATAWNGAGFAEDGPAHCERWRTEFSVDQIDRATDLIDTFGLGHLYGGSRAEIDLREVGKRVSTSGPNEPIPSS